MYQNEVKSSRRELGSEILGAREITKSFGGLRVLQGADVSVRHGEIVGLIGPNGSRQVDALERALRLIPADGGSVRFNGKDVTGWRVDPTRRSRDRANLSRCPISSKN